MSKTCNGGPAVGVSQLFPPFQRDALVRAAAYRDWQAIDRITDELARLGLVRPRDACARMTRAEMVAMGRGAVARRQGA